MAIQGQDEQRETRRLFENLWRKEAGKMSSPPTDAMRAAAIGSMVLELAKGQERDMTKALRLYVAVLWDLNPAELIQAFSRAAMECKFFPNPATLREFSSRPVSGDPIAAEARAGLQHILCGMRGPHGLKLADIPGKVLYGTEVDPKDANGDRVVPCDALRAPSTVFPLSRRLEATLVRLGWGDRSAGIAMIAEHPAVAKRQDDDRYQQNQLRASDEILRRFTDTYREVASA
jgi:hypothetical protein